MELSDYLPILIFFAAGLAVGGAILGLSKIARQRPNPVKELPYESGILPSAPVRQRFSIDFYLTAMLFIVFDVEVLFLYPFAVAFDQVGLFSVLAMLLFLVVVSVPFVYEWSRGGLEWE